MLLFTGTSNQQLAEKLSDELKIKISPSEIIRFADREVRVRILQSVKGEHIFVLQSLSQLGDANLMELCQFAEIAKREKAKKITAVIPYLAYARQHRAHRQGEAISVKLVADFLKVSGFDEVILLDLHEEEVLKYFKIPTIHLSAVEIFAQYIDANREDFGGDDLVIVAPDEGRAEQAKNLAKYLEVEFAVAKKKRKLDVPDTLSDYVLLGDVKAKDVVIFDDMISTGSTALHAAEICLQKGSLKVNFIATHAVLAKGEADYWEKSPFEKIYVSDSIFVPENKQFAKLQIVSIAPLVAKQLQNLV